MNANSKRTLPKLPHKKARLAHQLMEQSAAEQDVWINHHLKRKQYAQAAHHASVASGIQQAQGILRFAFSTR